MDKTLRRMSQLAVSLTLMSVSGLASAGPLDELPAGQWHQLPNSHMRAVAHDWGAGGTPGNVGGIIKAWGGGAFDDKGERLLINGGGHGDYGGNEVYALDLNLANTTPNTNPWSKLSSPSPRSALDDSCENADNLSDDDQRRSQHTYSRLAYLPELDALCDTGGSIGYTFCPALRQLDCFKLATGQWELNVAEGRSSGTGSVGAVHPVTGEWWLQGGSGSGLLGRFKPQALSWSYGRYDNIPGTSPGNMSATIDPKRNLLLVTGRQRLWVLPLDQFKEGETELSDWSKESVGGEAVINASAPGLAYDPIGDRVIAWIGGAEVYALSLDTWQWTKITPGGTPPGAAANNGTYGRFRYSPKYNVFVVVSSVDEDAYVLKLGETPAQCQPEQTQPCYSGDPARIGVGVCKQGQQPCEAGRWGECQDEVLPVEEMCGDALDNSCDGVVDEGCAAPDMGRDMGRAMPHELGADMKMSADMREATSEMSVTPDEGSPSKVGEGCGCASAAQPAQPAPALALLLLGGLRWRARRVRARR